jgi:hypothetical protein
MTGDGTRPVYAFRQVGHSERILTESTRERTDNADIVLLIVHEDSVIDLSDETPVCALSEAKESLCGWLKCDRIEFSGNIKDTVSFNPLVP